MLSFLEKSINCGTGRRQRRRKIRKKGQQQPQQQQKQKLSVFLNPTFLSFGNLMDCKYPAAANEDENISSCIPSPHPSISTNQKQKNPSKLQATAPFTATKKKKSTKVHACLAVAAPGGIGRSSWSRQVALPAPDLCHRQAQRLELLPVLLPRFGAVIGHEYQPLALRGGDQAHVCVYVYTWIREYRKRRRNWSTCLSFLGLTRHKDSNETIFFLSFSWTDFFMLLKSRHAFVVKLCIHACIHM